MQPTFFVMRMACTASCDPQGHNTAQLTQSITMSAARAALSLVNLSKTPAATVAPVRTLDESQGSQLTRNVRAADLGFDLQPAAETWRWRLDPDLQASDGQTVGTSSFVGRSTVAQQMQLPMAELLRQVANSTAPSLTISRTGTGRVYYTARVQYLAPESPEPVDRGFQVERRYEKYVPDGSGPPTTTFSAGDLVRVTVSLTLRGEGRYLALTDPLPAAFEPLEGWFKTTASDLARQATRTNNANDWLSVWRRGTFDHVEKHDDRVVAFATRLGSGRHEFSYLVRATTAGTFTAAGSRVEAMYAPEVTGRSAASAVTVR